MHQNSSAEAIAATLTHEIKKHPAGTRLESSRTLIKRFNASASTISSALSLLSERGLIDIRPGDGTYTRRQTATVSPRDTAWQTGVVDIPTSRTHPTIHRQIDATGLNTVLSRPGTDITDLASGYLHPSLQPQTLLHRASSRGARHPDAWKRGPLSGITELRSWFAQEIGGDLSYSDVTICSGGQSALSILMQALTQPGDQVAVEGLTYPGTIAAMRAASLHPIPIPMTSHGIDIEALDQILTQTLTRLIVVQPASHNPTGITMPQEQRQQLLDLARMHRVFVVEDDFARYLQHSDSPPALPPLIRDDSTGNVIHIRSLTKASSPNLRIAAIISRGDITQRIRDTQAIHSMLIPTPQQIIALELVTTPSWKRHLSSLGKNLAERRISAITALTTYLPEVDISHQPRSGYHLWLRLPDRWNSSSFAHEALAAGVSLSDGISYSMSSSPMRHVRISYVAAPASADITNAIRQLGVLAANPHLSL